MKIAVIDNYDSFVNNIIHYLEAYHHISIEVMKNDEINWKVLDSCDRILLSPGPGIPSEAGDLMKVIQKYYFKKNILGVCLGHQAIGEFFGCRLKNLDYPLHGISSSLKIFTNDNIFKNISSNTEVGHYHSWVIDSSFVSDAIEVLATDDYGHIMAIKHKNYPIYGVQFHPESVLTTEGRKMIENWVNE